MINIIQKIIAYEKKFSRKYSKAHHTLHLSTEQQVQCMEWEGGHPVDTIPLMKMQVRLTVKEILSKRLWCFQQNLTPFTLTPPFGV
jgi:hypothetical protein